MEDPRIANRSTSDGDAVDSGLTHHFQTIGGREKIAAAENLQTIADVLFDFFQKRPAARSDVPLHHRPAVHGHASQPGVDRSIENLKKLFA